MVAANVDNVRNMFLALKKKSNRSFMQQDIFQLLEEVFSWILHQEMHNIIM